MSVQIAHTTIVSENKNRYTIRVMDNDITTGTSVEFGVTYAPGFQLFYPDVELFTPIQGSELTVYVDIDDTAIETLMLNICTGRDNRYHILIDIEEWTGSGFAAQRKFWMGSVYYNEQAFGDRAFPYMFELKATDFLGRLSDVEYRYLDGNLVGGELTLFTHLRNALRFAGFEQYYTHADIYFEEVIRWKETKVITAADLSNGVLQSTRLHTDAFININRFDELEPVTCYKVIESILKLMNARICMNTRGRWSIMQVDAVETESRRLRYYNKDVDFLSSELLTAAYSIPDRSAGGETVYLPAVKTIKSNYTYRAALAKNLLPAVVNDNVVYALRGVLGGSGERLQFQGLVYTSYTPDPGEPPYLYYDLSVRLTLQVGSFTYWLKREGESYVWSETAATLMFTHYNAITSHLEEQVVTAISFVTPAIPLGGSARFKWEVLSDALGEIPSYATDFILKYIYPDPEQQPGDGVIQYVGNNTDQVGNMINNEVEEVDNIIGDGPLFFSLGRLRIHDGTQWINSEQWVRTGDVGALPIHDLMIRERLLLTAQPLQRYAGDTPCKNFSPDKPMLHLYRKAGVTVEGKWLFIGGVFSATNEFMDGRWILITADRDSMWESMPVTYQPELPGPMFRLPTTDTNGAGVRLNGPMAKRNSLVLEDRYWGMTFYVFNDNDFDGRYVLTWNYADTDLANNANWQLINNSAGIGGVSEPDAILSGGIVTWTGTGLNFQLSKTVFRYIQQLYTIAAVFTLDPGDALPRFDMPVLTLNAGVPQLIVLKGVASANPAVPSHDPSVHLPLQPILIAANATTPDVTQGIIYNENGVGEWIPVAAVGTTIDADNTEDPSTGTKAIKVTNISNNDTITFPAPASINLTEFETLSFDIKLREKMINRENIYLQWMAGGVAASSQVLVSLAKDSLTYQNIGIALNEFLVCAKSIDALQIRWSRSGGDADHPGFFLDNVKIESGIAAPIVNNDHNFLKGLQGGTETERYHLDKLQHEALSQITQVDELPLWKGEVWPVNRNIDGGALIEMTYLPSQKIDGGSL